ncbi:efflux RND transporter periplasmic adaptor subunit [Flavilitoribacter nigricans]|uniref:Efflux transporter periplasmic adaptor subunit n=1 Tax=Flavilitoribacter nigricans (strain ATCC 23147 / DSM 23189 / NBRC 102662 / NCIMB 1420 / SS-2) TaxID=1122177 RepID=A0A2D0N8V9_FLAN2|nr:HlyD family efflux transporter periplasmic adaptor subunit [Flavilitoribacter nigricans]PHN04828.1 efflux transporter periplasmic adaptor subunit [Flavilitoribacter nigricans DSM 23189 = NBRC 102662]
MDRPVEERIQRQRTYRRLWQIGLALIVVVAGIWGLRKMLGGKVDQDRLRVAVAETGPISNTLSAMGEVIPAYEQVVTSPIQADIREVLIEVGRQVEPGDPILLLDKSFFLLNFDKQKQELDLQENRIDKLRFALAKDQFDLEIKDSIKALEIYSLEAAVESAKRLKQIGGGTDEGVDEAVLRLKIARLEKKQLENDLLIRRQSTSTEVKELEIQANIQRNSIQEMEEKLKRAEVVASRPGVLTWANENIGSTVSEGETLARIADLGSYKVTGTLSDVYAERISPGQAVNIRLSEAETISGRITNIRPTVENNLISFDIQLDEPDHAALRPNMRVELFIITATKPQVIRVANGPAFKGRNEQALFVMRNGVAEKRMVRIGLANSDYVELENNIAAGETIVISDMSRYEHMDKVDVR